MSFRQIKDRSLRHLIPCVCDHIRSPWHDGGPCRALKNQKPCPCLKFEASVSMPAPVHKYRNRFTECRTGHNHRSKLEATVCDRLLLEVKAGSIRSYRREVPIRIYAPGTDIFLWTYVCDFVLEHLDGSTEYREAKGLVFGRFKKSWEFLQARHAGDPKVKFSLVTR